MKFTLSIDMNNAAFADADELARILRNLADGMVVHVRRYGLTPDSGSTFDINGNNVGTWRIKGKRG